MHKLKAIQSKLEKMMWFAPVIIIGIGAVPSVAGSVWWDVVGVILFVTIVIISAIGWQQND